MVEIRQIEGGFELMADTYREIFRTKAKVVVAAHCLALGIL